MNPNGLSNEQLDVLLAARNCEEPIVIEQETHDRVRQLLGDVLEANHQLRDGAALPLTAQLEQLEADDNADDILGQQHPETGGATADELDADESDPTEAVDPVDALRAHPEPTEIKRKLSLADSVERNGRLPERAAELRRECSDALDVPVEHLAEIERPSEPTMI